METSLLVSNTREASSSPNSAFLCALALAVVSSLGLSAIFLGELCLLTALEDDDLVLQLPILYHPLLHVNFKPLLWGGGGGRGW